jgi:hypothetical protein
MNKTAQRIAIAKWMGLVPETRHHAPSGTWDFVENPLPDFTRDLNAMAEAEMRLTVGDQWALYYSHFVDGGGVKINATAASRAEALLRTLGLWIDDAPPTDRSVP